MNKQIDEIMQLVSEYAITCLTYARTQDKDDLDEAGKAWKLLQDKLESSLKNASTN